MLRLNALLEIGVGILIGFLGYRLLRFTLVLVGLGLGVYAGMRLVHALHLAGPGTLILPLMLAVLGALLLALVFKLGVFLLGATAAAVIAYGLSSMSGIRLFAVLGLAGAAGGILALLLQRPVLSLLTGLLGAWIAVTGLFHPALVPLPESDLPVKGLAWLGLGITGFLVQVLTTGKKRKGK